MGHVSSLLLVSLGALVSLVPSGGCSATPGGGAGFGPSSEASTGDTGATSGADPTSGTDSGGTSTSTSTSASSTGGGPKFDVGPSSTAGTAGTAGPGDVCKVGGGVDGSPPCVDKAPPDSFSPEVQWEWSGPEDFDHSFSIPVVANLTDDNGDGEVDLCDVPDVVVLTSGSNGFDPQGQLYLLDGATGTEHLAFPDFVNFGVNAALGDLNGDGVAEIVAVEYEPPGSRERDRLIAYEADGTVLWRSSRTTWDPPGVNRGAVAIADLDNDGTPEVLLYSTIFDHEGGIEQTNDLDFGVIGDVSSGGWANPTAADLDGDRDLEAVYRGSAWHRDGTVHYKAQLPDNGSDHMFPQVADLDDDGQPEVIIVRNRGITLVQHDGTVTFGDFKPAGFEEMTDWGRPATIHDFDGDGGPEFAMSASVNPFGEPGHSVYLAMEPDASVVWANTEVIEITGSAAGTAFDFLGDGTAEAMYGDELHFRAFDDAGNTIFEVARTSQTLWEYPVVVDVDNDGSAEVLVVANTLRWHPTDPNLRDPIRNGPTLQVIRDAEDRWVPARRIWNQATYHVTNVREDGTIPQFEPPHYQLLNTFRTQAQVAAGGGVCNPVPEG